MNSIMNYFESPTKRQPAKSSQIGGEDKINSSKKSVNTELTTKKSKNQEIVKNMEEVLSLVKKQHRIKHKNKNEKKIKHHKHHKNSHNENDGSCNKLTSSKANLVNTKGKKNKKKHKNGKTTIVDLLSPTKNSLQNGKVSLSEISTNNKDIEISDHIANKSVLNHVSFDDKSPNKVTKPENSEDKKTVNAFEFLMNARNKSIGGNSPGKGSPESLEIEITEKRKNNLKRKLLLEEWADRKGAKRQKLKEAAREQYIEEEMDKRAIRFREMIESQSKINRGTKKYSSEKSKEKGTIKNERGNVSTKKKVDKMDNIERTSENKSEKETDIRRSVRNSRKLIEINNENSLADDFLMNLSSPMKGKQNLYGYFEKTTPSPTESNKNLQIKQKSRIKKKTKICNENSQSNANGDKVSKRGRKKKDSKIEIDAEKLKSEVLNSTPKSTERPRRSCVGKARYDINDYELDSSYEKNKSSRKKIYTANIDESNDVIILDNTASPICRNKEEESINKSRKLAPLFVKAVSTQKVDPERLKARQDFLMSGIPEKMKIDIAKMKQFEQNYELYCNYFPKFNHVPSWVFDESSNLINLENLNIVWKNVDDNEDDYKTFNLKRETPHEHTNRNMLAIQNIGSPLAPLSHLKSLENKRLLIKEWKNLYDKFPTYKCYNQLREKYRYFSAMDTAVDTREVTESFIVSTRRSKEPVKCESDISTDPYLLDNVKPPTSAPNGELQFCDKYKPLVSEQILVNLTPVHQLKEFLSNWQNKNKDFRNEELEDCSFDCMNDTSSNLEIPNCVVLVGPTSSGKTNAVSALANELNFNVLEINAGMKRSGKKLLQNLQEATQSHQIRKDLKKSNLLLKRSLSGLKKNKDSSTNENSVSSEVDSNTKLSLILVEDADILFENHDQGFVEAIYQLVGISKRPVVVLANDKNCPHLQKLINQNYIEFTNPHSVNISKYLTILSLMENCPIHLDDIVSLYYFNKTDLRKTILEIQFFIQSGGDRNALEEFCKENSKSPVKSYFASPKKGTIESDNMIESDNVYNLCKEEDDIKEDILVSDKSIKKLRNPSDIYIHRQLFEFFTVSQNIRHKIPFPINFDLLWININEIFKGLNSDNCEKNKGNIKNCNEMANIVDFYDSISLASNIDTYNSGCGLINSIEHEISHYLVEESIGFLIKTDELSYNLFHEKPRSVENIVSHIAPGNQRSKRSIGLEYEPMLRSICRSEKAKSSQKRVGSRYYHYLRNIAFNMNTFSLQLFDDVCPIFVDDQEKFIEYKQFEHSNNDWLN